MINKIKLYVILGLIVLVAGIVVHYSTTYTFVKKKDIEQKTKVISILIVKVKTLDSLVYSLQQDVDIAKQNEGKLQSQIDEQKKRAIEALAAEKRATEAIEHYEQNDLIRYFVFNKQGIFKKGCYQEVFKKPDNICK